MRAQRFGCGTEAKQSLVNRGLACQHRCSLLESSFNKRLPDRVSYLCGSIGRIGARKLNTSSGGRKQRNCTGLRVGTLEPPSLHVEGPPPVALENDPFVDLQSERKQILLREFRGNFVEVLPFAIVQ